MVRRAHGNARKFAERNAGVIRNGVFGTKLEGGQLLKEQRQYIAIHQIMAKSTQALVADITTAAGA